jgi:gamma-glutamyltranspeptidase/glutathione hydrolase
MALSFVFDQLSNRLVMNLGSAGGPSIINYVAKTITGVLDRHLNIQEAIDFPNMGSRNQETEIEKDTIAQEIVPYLKNKRTPNTYQRNE